MQLWLCSIILSQGNRRSKNKQQQPCPYKSKTEDKDVKVFLRLTVKLWILALDSQAIVCVCVSLSVFVVCACLSPEVDARCLLISVWCFERYLIEPGVYSFKLANQGVTKSHVPLLSPSSGVQEVYPFLAFMWVLAIRTEPDKFMQQVLCLWQHFSRPHDHWL